VPYRRTELIRKVLSGLLVLVVLLLPVGDAGAATSPGFADASQATLAGHDDAHSALTISPAHSASGMFRDGSGHPDDCACCLSCGLGVANLPSLETVSLRFALGGLSYLMVSYARPDGLSRGPDLPPPRHIV
jgi:hypothetical protein